MRTQPISTPFGDFNMMSDCARHIMSKEPQKFLQDNAALCNFRFTAGQKQMPAAELMEYQVYRTVKALVDDQSVAEWCRIPTRPATAVQAPIQVAAKPSNTVVHLVSLNDLAKFGQIFIGHTVKITG